MAQTQGKTFEQYRLLFISKFNSIDKRFDELITKHDKLDEITSDHILEDAKWKAKITGYVIGISGATTTFFAVLAWVVSNFLSKG